MRHLVFGATLGLSRLPRALLKVRLGLSACELERCLWPRAAGGHRLRIIPAAVVNAHLLRCEVTAAFPDFEQ